MEQQFLQGHASYVESKYRCTVRTECICCNILLHLVYDKIDKSMTSAFRKICKEHERSHIDTIQMICTLGNTFLNLQQMSAKQAVHIALSLPLTCSSRKCVFINTSPLEKHTFVLKSLSLLEQEPDNSEDVICRSIIDYYLQRPSPIRHIFLAEFVSHYKKMVHPYQKEKNPL